MKLKKLSALILAALMAASAAQMTLTVSADNGIPDDLTALDVTSRMGVGWNLGNTFDVWRSSGANAHSGDITEIETAWLGGPNSVTTQSLISAVKAQGFGTIRIPVTWSKVADPENDWLIREDWMDRVKEVVGWALDEGFYVILNAHHEEDALNMTSLESTDGLHFISNIWRQVAEVFRDYDERLIFEGLNEPRSKEHNEWGGGNATTRSILNEFNQAFVDAVRADGGNNENRILMIPAHAAGSGDNHVNGFVIPADLPRHMVPNTGAASDTVSKKIIWSVHSYAPFAWAHDGQGDELTPVLYNNIADDFNDIKTKADNFGVPVVLGEWGSVAYAFQGEQSVRNLNRPLQAEAYVQMAVERGFVPVVWDNGGFRGTGHTFGLIHRPYPHDTESAYFGSFQPIIDAIMAGAGFREITPVIFADSSLTDGAVGTQYSITLNSFGRPASWALQDGSLPAGLTLNPQTGEISGTPTAEGEFAFTITAANSEGSDSRLFTVRIVDTGGQNIYRAYLRGVGVGWYPGWQESSADNPTVQIVGDGTYTVTLTRSSGGFEFLQLQTDLIASEASDHAVFGNYPGATLVVDSVKVDGSDLELNPDRRKHGEGDGGHFSGSGPFIRHRIGGNAEWARSDTAAVTENPFPNAGIVEVTFTISGMGAPVLINNSEDNYIPEDPEDSEDVSVNYNPDPEDTTDRTLLIVGLAALAALIVIAVIILIRKKSGRIQS
jgi:endoglucanase